jgi:hypothetical protein
MAIYGAVAYRANRLQMVNGKLRITSPSFSGFEWPAEPVAWAECNTCPKDNDGHIDIQEDCTCGIYSGTNLEKTISWYMDDDNYVPILVEALGYYWMHISNRDPEVKGLTSAGAQVIAVIGDYRPDDYAEAPEIWIEALASFYKVPIKTVEEAQCLVDWAWNRFYEDNKEVSYDPNASYKVSPAWLRGKAHSG